MELAYVDLPMVQKEAVIADVFGCHVEYPRERTI